MSFLIRNNNSTKTQVCQECCKARPGKNGNTQCATCGGKYWKVNFGKNHPGYQQRKARLSQNAKILYHQTAPNFADVIIKSKQMKRGSTGMAGGGIYFACSPQETEKKAHSKGVILKCLVKLGNTKTIHVNGDNTINFLGLLTQSYDSVLIPRPGGIEYVVYNYDQVIIVSDNRGNKVGCEHGDKCTRKSSKHIGIFHKEKAKKLSTATGNLVCKYGKFCSDFSEAHQKKWHSYEKKKGECKYGSKCYKTNQDHITKYHSHESAIPCKFGGKCYDQTPEHRKKFDHPSKNACRFAEKCYDQTPEHRKKFDHPSKNACRFAEKCYDTSPEHRSNFDHPSKKACRFGEKCYDTSPEHRNKFGHVSNSSDSSDSDSEDTPCKFGAKCYNQDADHRKKYTHPSFPSHSTPNSPSPSTPVHLYRPTRSTPSTPSAPSTPSFKAKKPCKFGEKCYNHDAEHRQKYDH